jgi:hypothetical protein
MPGDPRRYISHNSTLSNRSTNKLRLFASSICSTQRRKALVQLSSDPHSSLVLRAHARLHARECTAGNISSHGITHFSSITPNVQPQATGNDVTHLLTSAQHVPLLLLLPWPPLSAFLQVAASRQCSTSPSPATPAQQHAAAAAPPLCSYDYGDNRRSHCPSII